MTTAIGVAEVAAAAEYLSWNIANGKEVVVVVVVVKDQNMERVMHARIMGFFPSLIRNFLHVREDILRSTACGVVSR